MCYSALVKRDLHHLEQTYGAVAVREQIDSYLKASQEHPKLFPAVAERIYPGSYGPVLFNREKQRVYAYMRYGAYPPEHIQHPTRYTTFNARLDNLTSPFWADAFLHHHGFVVLERFYEWVEVKDLLSAGVITLEQVKANFAATAAERRQKVEAAGKRWQATPTELKDPRLRKIIIEFRPQDERELIVPTIFSTKTLDDGRIDAGFAIVTHDPPPEISEAGHDRCPVILPESALSAWLNPALHSASELQSLLEQKRRVHFTHQLPEAA